MELLAWNRSAQNVVDASGQEYWPGGHARRMQQRLAAWQQEAALPS